MTLYILIWKNQRYLKIGLCKNIEKKQSELFHQYSLNLKESIFITSDDSKILELLESTLLKVTERYQTNNFTVRNNYQGKLRGTKKIRKVACLPHIDNLLYNFAKMYKDYLWFHNCNLVKCKECSSIHFSYPLILFKDNTTFFNNSLMNWAIERAKLLEGIPLKWDKKGKHWNRQ
jgi:hypothetical protein